MKNIPSILYNRYFLTLGFFVVWMLFFDQKDVFTQLERKKELNKLRQSKAFYEAEIQKTAKELTDLQRNTQALEKFAREKFYMKKDGEDVFIVEDSLVGKTP